MSSSTPTEPVAQGTAPRHPRLPHFRKGNPLLSLRDELGVIFTDADFADLFPRPSRVGSCG